MTSDFPLQFAALARAAALLLVSAVGVLWGPGMASAKTPAEVFAAHAKGSRAVVDHLAWDGLLKEFVVPGTDGLNRVDYRRFKAEGHQRLKSYIKAMTAIDIRNFDRPEQFAYWANLYNAKTIDIVLDKYPVKSIKDISLGGGLVATITGGPWKARVLEISGLELSLDDIEHGILRPLFKDPRAHYAVNCASIGCPNLGTDAFTGAGLEVQLDASARAYVNHPRGIAVDGGNATASSIYSWFQEDFGGNDAGVLAHIKRYAGEALKSKLEGITQIDSYGYDWSLNEAKSAP
jgi:hypothetical protein